MFKHERSIGCKLVGCEQWYELGPALLDQVDKELRQRSGGRLELVGALRHFFLKYSGHTVTAKELVNTLEELQQGQIWAQLFGFGD